MVKICSLNLYNNKEAIAMHTPRIKWRKTINDQEHFDCKQRKRELNKKIRHCEDISNGS